MATHPTRRCRAGTTYTRNGRIVVSPATTTTVHVRDEVAHTAPMAPTSLRPTSAAEVGNDGVLDATTALALLEAPAASAASRGTVEDREAAALSYHLPASDAKRLSRDRSGLVRWTLAATTTDAELLDAMLTDATDLGGPHYKGLHEIHKGCVILAIAGNPNAHPDTLALVLDYLEIHPDTSQREQLLVGNNPASTAAIRDRIPGFELPLSDGRLTPEVYKARLHAILALTNGQPHVPGNLELAAMSPHLTPELSVLIYEHPGNLLSNRPIMASKELAENVATDPNVLAAIADEGQYYVAFVLLNPSLRAAKRAELLARPLDGDALNHPRCPPELLARAVEALADDYSDGRARRLARNPSLTRDHLHAITVEALAHGSMDKAFAKSIAFHRAADTQVIDLIIAQSDWASYDQQALPVSLALASPNFDPAASTALRMADVPYKTGLRGGSGLRHVIASLGLTRGQLATAMTLAETFDGTPAELAEVVQLLHD